MMKKLLPLLAFAVILICTPVFAKTVPVAMEDFQFNPSAVTIDVGDEVVWTNTGSAPHTVTAEDGSFNSGLKNSGDAFRKTFGQPGTVAYRCDFHKDSNGMTGTIIVQAPNPPPQNNPPPPPPPPAQEPSAVPAAAVDADGCRTETIEYRDGNNVLKTRTFRICPEEEAGSIVEAAIELFQEALTKIREAISFQEEDINTFLTTTAKTGKAIAIVKSSDKVITAVKQNPNIRKDAIALVRYKNLDRLNVCEKIGRLKEQSKQEMNCDYSRDKKMHVIKMDVANDLWPSMTQKLQMH